MMLRRFLYLDKAALSDYVSTLEDGLREKLERRSVTGGSSEGAVNARIASAGVAHSQEREESTSLSDTPAAQFTRLLDLARKDPEAAGWIEVLNPDDDLKDVGIGALIEAECDIYVPEVIQALASSGGLVEALNAMAELEPYVKALGLDTANLPARDERDSMKGFIEALGGSIVAVGEFDASSWRLAGQLDDRYINGDLDGPARIVGKVTTTWPANQWKPLLALPGSSLLPRAQRRELARKPPAESQKDQYLEGPALMLDVLAIYR
jgi:hypothetical protein